MTPADQKAENDKTVVAFVEAAKVAVERLQAAVRTSEQSALRQTRGEPSDEEAYALWEAGFLGVPDIIGDTTERFVGRFTRALLAKWGGSGLGEAEVRERERKAFEIGAWYGYNVPLQSDFAQTAEREALHRYPAPPAAPKSVTCERCGGEIDFSETPSGPVSHYKRDDCIRALAAQVRQEGR